MFKKLLATLSMLFLLSGCQSVEENSKNEVNLSESSKVTDSYFGIDVQKPHESAEFLKELIDLPGEVTEEKIEMYSGIKDGYEIGEDAFIILNDDQEIEQINIRNINRTEITSVLESIDFPITDSIKEFLLKTELENDVVGDSYFTNYKDTGVSLTMKGSVLKKDPEEKDYSLMLLYNRERFDEFK